MSAFALPEPGTSRPEANADRVSAKLVPAFGMNASTSSDSGTMNGGTKRPKAKISAATTHISVPSRPIHPFQTPAFHLQMEDAIYTSAILEMATTVDDRPRAFA